MNDQPIDRVGGIPSSQEADNSSDDVATSSAVPGKTESASSQRSEGKIQISALLNPMNETTFQIDAQDQNESNHQEDRNEYPSSMHHEGEGEGEGEAMDICPAVQPASAMGNVATQATPTGSPIVGGSDGDIQCEICFKTFKNAPNLELHKHNAHNGTPVAFCDKCPANFTSNRALAFHKWDHHCQPKLNGPLRRQKRKHFRCSHCGFSARKKILVKYHEKMVHGDADSPEFPCKYCCGFVGESEATRQAHEAYCQKAPNRDEPALEVAERSCFEKPV